jgi:hypothetical protein
VAENNSVADPVKLSVSSRIGLVKARLFQSGRGRFNADHRSLGPIPADRHRMGRGRSRRQQWLDSFVAASMRRRTIVKPGDKIPIQGLEALVVASDGKLLDKPVKGGGRNPLCATERN